LSESAVKESLEKTNTRCKSFIMFQVTL